MTDQLEAGSELNLTLHRVLYPKHNINSSGTHYCAGKHERSAGCSWTPIPRYSTSITAAWEVVEKWLADHRDDTFLFEVFCIDGDGWCCTLKLDSGKTVGEARKQHTAQMAICLAVLDAWPLGLKK